MSKDFHPSAQIYLAIISTVAAAPLFAAGTAIYFDIAAQPLSEALLQFSESSGIKVFFSSDKVKNLKTEGVSGKHTPEEALQILLERSGLQYRYTGADTVTIENQPATPQDSGVSGSAATLATVHVTGSSGHAADAPYSRDYSIPDASTATKTDIAIMDTPVSIQVVPKAIMNDQQIIRIEDALTRNVSGVQRAYGTADMYESFIIRGFASDDQMYRNGFRRSMGVYDPSNIEQLEVLKGPASVLYGRLQPGGMVNYVTKKALDAPYYSLQQQFGSYGEFRTTFDATGPLDQDKTLLYRFNGAFDTSDSFRDYVERERIFIAPTLTWRPNEQFEANLEIEKRHENYVDDFGIPVSGNRPVNVRNSLFTGDPSITPEQDNTLVYADWSFKFNQDWAIKHKFQWDETDIVFGSVAPNGPVNADGHTLDRMTITGTSNRRSYATSLDLTGKFETWGLKHNVLLGGDYFFFNQDAPDNKFASSAWGDPINSGFDLNDPQYGTIDLAALNAMPANWFWRSRDDWYGVYFQDQITLWDKLHIMGGGRYDMAGYGGFGGASWEDTKANFSMQHENHFSPRVGVVYQPWRWLSLYGNYVESFGSNNGRSAMGGTFAPQAAEQYEVGFKTEFFDQRLSSTVAFYHLTKTNILISDLSTVDPWDQQALGKARSQGIEVDIKGQVTDNFSLVATYAYTDARVTEDNPRAAGGLLGNRLLNVPEHQASLWGTYQFTEQFKAGLGGVAVDTRAGDAANTYELPGYVRLDAMAAYAQPFGKSLLTAQININNVLDKDYYSGSTTWLPTANVGAPISVLGSLKLEY